MSDMPDPNVQTFAVGAATVTVVNVGDAAADLREWFKLPEEMWRPRYGEEFDHCKAVPIQSILIRMPEVTILIDPSVYDFEPGSPSAPPNYTPPAGLLERLHAIDTHEDEIDHIVITHAHGDHYNGLTDATAETPHPCYPRAHCHIGRADWTSARMQERLGAAGTLENRTLGVLNEEGLIELVRDRYTLAPGVEIIPTPGETPGHLAVRIESRGEVLYCLGDLYHHTIEVEQPDWMVHWADRDSNVASRNAFAATALAENARLVATHIPGVGQLESTPTGMRWKAV